MSSLREVKDRIDSVRSTLKITSAMKLVASSKLRKAQRVIESMRPYQQELERILSAVLLRGTDCIRQPEMQSEAPAGGSLSPEDQAARPKIILAFSSNSSMCGAFNANVIKKTLETFNILISKGLEVQVWGFGRKVTDALRSNGTPAARDYSSLVSHPDFAQVADIASELRGMRAAGSISDAILVYNHFVSTGRQQVTVESFFETSLREQSSDVAGDYTDYIVEPSREELLDKLLPQVSDLKLYTTLLDSAASEHAARMVAMQAATDNGQELLSELTLEYNKGRQQKITSEILDLVGGAAQQI